ncbi:hypothetical protein ET475_13470 [Microbacterium protaetiae]|uniref:Uncharacterized protein n=1 Tax=Microbacterium protaetiae TaxID=2509458 RepID=A0A4P6EL34_9MICO|nr:hypothetical protein [Microbacterium protaetiae]QAY60897.1 hypothetical protein ET475_13470 [Microbacterium protaetiae]
MTTQTASPAALATPETCPLCTSVDVRVVDDAWFVIELDRADDLREPAVAFSCRECGWHWD